MKMAKYTIYEAKTQLSQLLKRAAKGEEVIITHRETPVARLIPIAPAKKTLGFLSGKIEMTEDFDQPLADFEEYMK